MDLERLIERTIAIQSIPAPTFSEGARAAWIHKEFGNITVFKPEQDPIGNVYLRIPGGDKPPLIITAHLDTVFPNETVLQIQRSTDCIYGPGIGDNSLSLGVLLELAEDLTHQPLPGDVWLVANVGEEGLGNLLGMRQVVSRFGAEVTGYIVLEGMSLGHIYYRGLSIQRFRISAEGPGGHSWIHSNRPSAIHVLARISDALLKLELSEKPKSTLNIGLFHGGTTINSIAGKAYIELDLRSETPARLEHLVLAVNELISSFEIKDITLTLEGIGERPGGSLDTDHPLLKAAKQALNHIGEADIQLEIGSTDANVPLSMGLPAICIGLTRGGGAHSLEEYIEIPPITHGYEALLKTIEIAFEVG
jgi:acetylornithine deacetylase/succinyl-diaminopimelate desuccinylase-like protein